jgi:hypothetical protein
LVPRLKKWFDCWYIFADSSCTFTASSSINSILFNCFPCLIKLYSKHWLGLKNIYLRSDTHQVTLYTLHKPVRLNFTSGVSFSLSSKTSFCKSKYRVFPKSMCQD